MMLGASKPVRLITDEPTEMSAPPVSVWFGFGAMCLGMFMAVLDIQIVATALPDIQAALGIKPSQMSWIQTAYLIAEVIAIPLTGWLIRLLGLRDLALMAITGFTLASLVCALSTGFASLIAGRILQGLFGGCLIPLVFSAVFLFFPSRLHGFVTTIAGVLAVLAPTIGPLIGGWITDTYSWHWLFLINLAPGIIAILVIVTALTGGRRVPGTWRELDWLALGAMAIALAALEIALKTAPEDGWLSLHALAPFVLAMSAGILFIRRMWRAVHRFVDLRLLADRDLALGCGLSFLLGCGLYGSVYLMPVFLAFVRLHSSFEIGETMLVTGCMQLLCAPVAAALDRRCDARLLSIAGFIVFAAGLGLSYWATWETDFDGMFWPQIVRGSAIMFCLLSPTRIALDHLPPARVPDASALFNLMRNLGGAIGLALIDTVIWGRAPVHVKHLVDRLLAGDAAAARFVGLPTERFVGKPMPLPDQATQDLIRPLLERAGLVAAIDEAWALLAVLAFAAACLVVLISRRHRPAVPAAVPVNEPGGESR